MIFGGNPYTDEFIEEDTMLRIAGMASVLLRSTERFDQGHWCMCVIGTILREKPSLLPTIGYCKRCAAPHALPVPCTTEEAPDTYAAISADLNILPEEAKHLFGPPCELPGIDTGYMLPPSKDWHVAQLAGFAVSRTFMAVTERSHLYTLPEGIQSTILKVPSPSPTPDEGHTHAL